ncbi:COG2 family protein [Rhodotorula paludigena]|uniref:COG2 family protein n=1 Tax=Rhodotorula paludigena TaxID=86838 RepID=UPI0031765BF6
MAGDALEDPFNPDQTQGHAPEPRPQALGVPKPGHRPTLTALLSTTDLDQATASDLDLPTAPPLSHAVLAGDDFDASDFLLARRHAPLDDLRSEFRAYLATLRTSLVGVINEEYEAFIGLSLGLKHANVAHSLATIRRPVLSIRAEVTRVQHELDDMRAEMSAVLDERKDVREQKALMRRLLATDEAVAKVESLLNVGDAADKARALDLSVDSPAKRLERVASEYTHMRYLVERAGDLPFVKSLEPRISRTTTALQSDLSALLSSILAGSPSAPSYREELTTALRTFASLGLVSQAEDLIRTSVVRPFLRHAIHRDALSPSSASSSSPPDTASAPAHVPPFYRLDPLASPAAAAPDAAPLAALFNRVLAFVAHECGVLLDVAERTLADVPVGGGKSGGAAASSKRGKEDSGAAPEEAREKVEGFEVLANVVVDEVATALVGELGSVVFAAGRPTVFHQNYLLTTAFIARLESICPTLARLHSLRAHASYTSLLKRFQLPVYFQLRLKDAVTSIERAFDVGAASGGGGHEGFVMSESEAVFRALRRCWDDDVWLEELAGRFWRLTLQILSRYRTWLNDNVPRYVLPSSSSNANLSALAAGNPPSRSSADGDRSRLTPSAGGTRPGTPGAGDDVSEETTLRQLTVLIADARLMERKAEELFSQRMQARLPGESEAGAADVMAESLSAVTSLVPSLSSQIVTILVKRSVEPLKLVRSVASQVRASTRKGPLEPSYFVHSILKELGAYLAGPGRVVEEELRVKWATAVVDDIAGRYAAILSTQKKTEDSLRWLKKGRQGLSFFGRATSTAPDDGSTDDDRVKQQMQLDVEALAEDAKALGVDVDASEAFQGLRRATTSEGKEGEEKK